MTCPSCGADVDPAARTCPACATPLATPDLSETSSGESVDASDEASTDAIDTSGPPEPPRDTPLNPPPGGGYPGPASGAASGAGWPPAPGPGWSAPTTHHSGLSSETRGWGIAAHLSGLGGALVTVVTLGFLGPLVIWLLKRDEHPFVDHHAKEALNFQLTTLLAVVVSLIAAIPIVLLGFLTLGVAWLIAGLVGLAAAIAWFVLPIVGAVKAANGEGYRYPVSIRFVR